MLICTTEIVNIITLIFRKSDTREAGRTLPPQKQRSVVGSKNYRNAKCLETGLSSNMDPYCGTVYLTISDKYLTYKSLKKKTSSHFYLDLPINERQSFIKI